MFYWSRYYETMMNILFLFKKTENQREEEEKKKKQVTKRNGLHIDLRNKS